MYIYGNLAYRCFVELCFLVFERLQSFVGERRLQIPPFSHIGIGVITQYGAHVYYFRGKLLELLLLRLAHLLPQTALYETAMAHEQ